MGVEQQDAVDDEGKAGEAGRAERTARGLDWTGRNVVGGAQTVPAGL